MTLIFRHWQSSRFDLPWLALLLILPAVGCRDATTVQQSTEPVIEQQTATPGDRTSESATDLIQQRRWAEALTETRAMLIRDPDDVDAMQLAATAHAALGQYCDAASFLVSAADRRESIATELRLKAFDLHLRCGQFLDAEQDLRAVLEQSPGDVQANRLMAQLLCAQGRRFESRDHVIELIRNRAVTFIETLSLIDLSGPFRLVSYGDLVDRDATTLFLLGDARADVAANEPIDEVLGKVRRVRKQFPTSVAAAAFEGKLLSQAGRLEDFVAWTSSLPSGIESHPEYWSAVGQFLSLQDKHEQSIGAFAEACRLDPTDRRSMRGIIRALEKVGRRELSLAVRKRLEGLDRIFRTAKDADVEQAEWIAAQMGDLVRPWESAAWWMHAARMRGDLASRIAELDRRRAAILKWESGASDDAIKQVRYAAVVKVDPTVFPPPSLDILDISKPATPESGPGRPIRLRDVASAVGIRTTFQSGFPLDGQPFAPHQVNGGGIAAIDYDLDGRCDFYLTQAGGPPNDAFGSAPNQLFRQLDPSTFVPAAAQSNSDDRGYGQGVAAGDINQDGLPDLLIANIGRNRVLLNQGDGTFRSADRLIDQNADRWTSSIGLADLNGDRLPDMVEINYIDDPQVYDARCGKDYAACKPQAFHQGTDRILISSPTGRQTVWDQTQTAMMNDPKHGFGLVIANFDRQAGNDFFVTNDGDLNHYWHSSEIDGSDQSNFSLVESASIRGCSVGADGDSQACMGVAFGDFDRDGLLDLHVTNFYNEPSNLFIQEPPGYFTDEAVRYGVFEPSFGVLGFGTQAADFDHDGWLDLAVNNGHVFDARHEGIPFRMLPQVIRGGPRGFVASDVEGESYWSTKKVGRTLAISDYNRDGRIDLIANHLDAPVALLRNETDTQGWIQFELIGSVTERDAIGAEVVIQTDGGQQTAWQIGGDGYMCSNEPLIHFGIGDASVIESVSVSWPSGAEQQFSDIEAGRRYLLIEGQSLFPRE